jgi:D-alanine--poly(phosphoribitol) ligase subunit 2
MNKQERVVAIISQIAKKKGEPSPDESLFDSGFLDSFALADLVTALESEFAVRIPDSDLMPRKFESVSLIVSYLEARG